MEYYFSHTPIALDQKLIEKINLAQKTLDIAIYTLTKKEIVNAIIAAKQRGVIVRMICDKGQSTTPYQLDDIKNLQANHIPIKVNTHAGLMHLKVTIIDQQIITFGSYNYTKAATLHNDELLVIIIDPVTALDFTHQFEKMWYDTKKFMTLPTLTP